MTQLIGSKNVSLQIAWRNEQQAQLFAKNIDFINLFRVQIPLHLEDNMSDNICKLYFLLLLLTVQLGEKPLTFKL